MLPSFQLHRRGVLLSFVSSLSCALLCLGGPNWLLSWWFFHCGMCTICCIIHCGLLSRLLLADTGFFPVWGCLAECCCACISALKANLLHPVYTIIGIQHCWVVFQSDCINLHSCQQLWEFQLLHTFFNFIYFRMDVIVSWNGFHLYFSAD